MLAVAANYPNQQGARQVQVMKLQPSDLTAVLLNISSIIGR